MTEWRIPGSRMKMGEQHIVPLSRQALAILGELVVSSGACRGAIPTSPCEAGANTMVASPAKISPSALTMPMWIVFFSAVAMIR
jgi:hypothetical protein